MSSFYTHLPAYEDGTECSETSARKLQTPGNYPKENIHHTEHGKSLKSRIGTVSMSDFFNPPLQKFNVMSRYDKNTGIISKQ
jgi:hypothetical protein